ncbi:anaphase-promoting complex subunit 5 [Harmonia axyridis]|uniref:anaphase-promoting complex subunit 5 n=1 Tax=Harmonia axyridis TaxID=115357 RepID=UPI001E276F39|nr:anaphase-promoting complex subunit 5 [Harmonia axyridis]
MSSIKEEIPVPKMNDLDKLTPYRICISALIKTFHSKRLFDAVNGTPNVSKCTRDFCIMLIKVLQKPDLELSELWSLLISESYELPPALLITFKDELLLITRKGIEALVDYIDNLNRLMEYENSLAYDYFSIAKTSVVGVYLRRLIVNFDRLTFFEVTEVFSEFQKYCKDFEELSLEQENVKELNMDNWTMEKDMWTRRQAELFIATQAALVESNEGKAMNPKELQKVIANILKTNPDLAEAHFLAYLNYIRVKEYCGAIESLYGCFDLNQIEEIKNNEDKPKYTRYAALNLAALHYHFGHYDETLASLKEAIKLAQDANDNLCLQHAMAWLHRLLIKHNDRITEHSLLSSFTLSMSYRPSTSIQNCMKMSSICSTKPSEILDSLDKADIAYYQHNDRDLISNSYTIKSSLWQFYGKPEMSSLWSHLTLYLNIGNTTPTKANYGEPFCISICNVALQLLGEGKYNLAYSALNFAKRRFPDDPNCQLWMLCENLFYFLRALYHEQWAEAEAAARKMMLVDKWESYLRLAELYLYKEDHKEAKRFIDLIFDRYKIKDKYEFKGYQFVRAKLLQAQIEFSCNLNESLPPSIIDLLNDILNETKKYKLDYYTSMVHLVIANMQLSIGMAKQALVNLDKCMTQIMAHGGCYDRARCWLFYIKALTAESERLTNTQERAELILERITILDEVKDLFRRVEAFTRVKDVVYLQAKLYDQLGMKEERNKHALEFRTLNEEYVSKNMETLIRHI